jgi:hypothetical protein
MKEHPILFSTEMVQAILEGRKIMTRRVIKPQPMESVFDIKEHSGIKGYWIPYTIDKRLVNSNKGNRKNDCGWYCPYGQIGDRLWVRETWDFDCICDNPKCNGVIYKAGYSGVIIPRKWRPSIFMPRWASRITLEITNIKVERVSQILNTDVTKEGFSKRIYFLNYWDKLNVKRGYLSEFNTFVWVIEFKRSIE